MAPKRRREHRKRLCRYTEKGLAATSNSTGCADRTCSTAFRSMTSKLILVNQTIYCLLIQPNPDSALNSTAGHLLQEDYDSFSRQARLMTSIHGRIPSDLQDAAISAKRRGETACGAVGGDTEQKPTSECKSSSSLATFLVRKLPEGVTRTSTQSAPGTLDQALECESPASEDEHGTSALKENDPLLSSSPVPVTSPRRQSMTKRPLSDLYIIEPEHDITYVPRLSHSEQNVLNNVHPLTSITLSDSSGKGLQSAENIQRVDKSGCGQETGGDGTGSNDFEGRPTKRIFSDSGKENTETWGASKLIKAALPSISAVINVGVPPSGRASASSPLGTSKIKGRPRVGLRRL